MRGAAKATSQTTVFVLSIALFLLASTQAQPWLPLLAAWGIIELLFFLWILRLWFAPERVVIANSVVTYTYGLFGKTRTMPTSEVAAIHVVRGSATPRSAIRIKGAHWQVLHLGDGIRNQRDAEWLALQMSRAAIVKASGDGSVVLDGVQILDAIAADQGCGELNSGRAGDGSSSSTRAESSRHVERLPPLGMPRSMRTDTRPAGISRATNSPS
jgi:hypothetical protein